MFLSVRKFSNVKSPEVIIKAVETQLLPVLRGLPGFNAFYAAKFENGDFGTIGIFDTKANSDAATERAMGWVKQNFADNLPGEPVLMRGEVLLSGINGATQVMSKSA